MKLLANENIPSASVHVLRTEGFDVVSVGENFKGISDREVIEFAIKEGRTVITFDRDYGELVFRHGYRIPAGVIYLRWKQYQPDEPGRYLVELLRKESIDLSNALTVIDDDSIRQRKY